MASNQRILLGMPLSLELTLATEVGAEAVFEEDVVAVVVVIFLYSIKQGFYVL